MYGMPVIRMSAWPSTGTQYCSKLFASDLLVHRLGRAGVARRSARTRRGCAWKISRLRARAACFDSVQLAWPGTSAGRLGEVVLVLHQEVERAVEHPVVERRLDVEDLQVLVDERPMRSTEWSSAERAGSM